MKKLLVAMVAMFTFIFGMVSVNAGGAEYTKEQFLDLVARKVTLTENYKKMINDYVTEYPAFLSDGSADVALNAIDRAKAVVGEEINTLTIEEFKALPQATKNQLKNIVNDASSAPSINATLDKDGLTVMDPVSNNVWTKITDQVQNTNSNSIIIIIAGLVSVIGVSAVALKLKSLNA